MSMRKTTGHIIHSLKVSHDYLLSSRFVMMNDHIGLRYLFEHLNLNARQTRSLDTINKLYFNIRYINGKENRMADAPTGRTYRI